MESQNRFNIDDKARIKTTGETVIVLKYKTNYLGSLLNDSLGTDKYKDAIITDEVLCEGVIGGKFQRKYIKEANLELHVIP